MEIDYRNYSIKQMELILGMQEKGWQHIHYNHLIALIAEETEILVTSKGPFIFYREDTDD